MVGLGDADFIGEITRVFLAPFCVVEGEDGEAGESGEERFLPAGFGFWVERSMEEVGFFAGLEVRSTAVRFFAGAVFMAAVGLDGAVSRCGRAAFWRMKPGILTMIWVRPEALRFLGRLEEIG